MKSPDTMIDDTLSHEPTLCDSTSELPVDNSENVTRNKVIEAPVRFSQSRLWELQRAFFLGQGVEAWRNEIVPHYVTSNPFIARSCARQVMGVFRDLVACGINTTQPVYIVELGAGCGRFAYHFLTNFPELLSNSALAKVRYCYVMTDHAEKTLEFWRQHEQLAPFVERGQLDFSLLDTSRSSSLELERSGVSLTAGNVANPMVVIANYVFDSLPHDAYRAYQGELTECFVGLNRSDCASDKGDIKLEHVEPVYEYRTLSGLSSLSPRVDEVLKSYREELTDGHFMIPVGALGCLESFKKLASKGLVLVGADMGHVHVSELERNPAPTWNTHGSISLTVNYDAIARFVRNSGGEALLTPPAAAHLTVGTFLLGMDLESLPETRLAFQEAFIEPGPDAFFTLKKQLEQVCHHLSFRDILAYLRLSHWDGKILLVGHSRLLELISQGLTPAEEESLCGAARRIWEQYFALADSFDLPFHLGMLLYRINYLPEAIGYFDHSLRIWGEHSATLHHLGLCHYGLRQFDHAAIFFDRALKIDADFRPARDMLQRLAAARRRETARQAENK